MGVYGLVYGATTGGPSAGDALDPAEIAEAVKIAINEAAESGGSLSMQFEAQRVYVPERDYSTVAQAEEVLCHVFSRVVDRNRESRRDVRKELEVSVVYARKISSTADLTDPSANPEVDALVVLGSEIAEVLAAHAPLTSGKCPVLRTLQDPLYDFEMLRHHRVFVAQIRVFVLRW